MKKITNCFFAVIALSSLFSCEPKEVSSEPVDGVWESIGYGRVLQIEGDGFLLVDVTPISCIPAMDGKLSDFGEGGIVVINDTLWVKDGINRYPFLRIEGVPELCQVDLTDEKRKDPLYNYDVLAATFGEHYPYFSDRLVNWELVSSTYRDKITPSTTDAELFKNMKEMLDSFGDGHVSINAPRAIMQAADSLAKMDASPTAKGENFPSYGRREVADAVSGHYFKKMESRRGGIMKWGVLEGDVGYIQLNQMMGFADYGIDESLPVSDFWQKYMEIGGTKSIAQHTQDELSGARTIIKEAMSELADMRTIIIDVRFNGGGKDEIGLELLRHFNDLEASPVLLFTKEAKTADGYGPKNIVTLEKGKNAYAKRFYILTSEGSASATEIFVMGSMALPRSIRVGANTNGIFSDILEKSLPNGWTFGLSNEVYLDGNPRGGKNHESVGIPPHIVLDYPKGKDAQFRHIMEGLPKGGDRAIERVLEHLEE